jgi:ADP-ribose pyrophosphatase
VPGTQKRTSTPVRRFVYEFPSGRIEPGEDPAQAAARELAEESGARAGALHPLGRFFTTAGSSNEAAHLFLADVTQRGSAGPEPGEHLSVQVCSDAEIVRMIDTGSLADAVSALAFMMARHHRAATAP